MGSDFAVNGSGANGLARRGFAVERRDAPDGRTVLACVGELDLATMPAFEDALCRAEADGRAIVLDLSGLDFIDSRGLAMVLALDWRLRERGGQLVIVRGPRAVQRMFELTGMSERFDFVDGPDTSSSAPTRVAGNASEHAAGRSAARRARQHKPAPMQPPADALRA
jgi:anti-sigma B factor antagonist